MGDAIVEVISWIAASPYVIARFIFGMFRRIEFWTIAYRHEIYCRNCGSAISLVGFWRCRCGYTYKGHVLRCCPVCDSLPQMVRCFQCGVTEELPTA